jgi:hypothetical protein
VNAKRGRPVHGFGTSGANDLQAFGHFHFDVAALTEAENEKYMVVKGYCMAYFVEDFDTLCCLTGQNLQNPI